MEIQIRLARREDIPALTSLIPLSVRTLQASYYTSAQIEGALGTVFAVDRQLICDKTYFIAENDSQIVATLAGEQLYTRFGYRTIEQLEIQLSNDLTLPGVKMFKDFSAFN